MKKILLLGLLVVSSAAFATNYHNSNYTHNKHHNNCYNNAINLTDAQRREIRDYKLDIQEKKLKISRLLNSEKIDWNQIENLNKEIALSRAKLNTEMLKIRAAQKTALPNNNQ